jgi:PAS domain S-box-containing protein
MEENLKILVVDDDEVDRLAVRRALKSANIQMELSEAQTCATALATLSEYSFDCVFLDYLLPDGDGLTLVNEIRQAGIKTPVVVLTGQGDEQIAVELMKAGASDYLSKSKLSPENLSKSLRNVIRLYRAEMQAALANQRRQESEERYRLVLEGANDAIWDWLIADDKIYWNDRFFEITGLSPDEFAGNYGAFFALIHPEDQPQFSAAIQAHLEQQVEFNVELRLRHVNGQYRYCIARAKAQRNLVGRAFRMSGTMIDLTERKQAEEALRFLAEASSILSASLDYQTTLKNLAEFIVPQLADWCVIDIVKKDALLYPVAVTHVDPAKAKWAQKLQQLYPLPPRSPFGPPQVLRTGQSEFYAEVSKCLLEAETSNLEEWQLLKQLKLKSAICVPMKNQGRTLGTITLLSSESNRRYDQASLALAEDLGRRAALAIDNARLYHEAQEANRMKDEFLATLSHELRTPLNAMLGWAQLLKSRKLDHEKTLRAIETIERNARSQTQMIEDLLDVSRIITGKLRLDFQSVELIPVVEAALDTVRPAATVKAIEIQCFFNTNTGVVAGDANRLQQIVWNLLSNAVKFTPHQGRVEVRLERIEARVQLQVKDNGIGISREFLPFVFERFRQADSTTARAYNGLGLGLAIVRHLVEMHGGIVLAESPGLEQGTTFTVQLPAQDRPAPEPVESTVAVKQSDALSLLQDLRVLVVDDEADARELLSVMLRQYGAQVVSGASASEALVLYEQFQPDVLVSDIGMPAEDGYSLIRRIRRLETTQGKQTPAVALTAYARDSDRDQALQAGFQVHLSKPVEPNDLACAVAQVVGRIEPVIMNTTLMMESD